MLSPDLQAAVCAVVVGGVGLLFTLLLVKRRDRNYKKMLRFCSVVTVAGLAYLGVKLLL